MSQLASWGKQQQWGAPLRWVIAVLLVHRFKHPHAHLSETHSVLSAGRVL